MKTIIAVLFSLLLLGGCATPHDDKLARLNSWQATAKLLRSTGELSPIDYDKQELEIVLSQPMNHLWVIWADRLSRQIEIRTAYQNGKISSEEANARLKKAAQIAIDRYSEDERQSSIQREISNPIVIEQPRQPTTTNCFKAGNSINCTTY